MTGVALSVLSAAIFTLIGFFFARPIAAALAPDPVTAGLSGDYLWICMTFCLGNLVCMVFQRLLQAAGNTLSSMVILVSGAITNIVLYPIMIFGLLGCPALGVRGAAIATVIGQWVSMIVGLVLNLKKNPDVKLTLKGFALRWSRVAGIYRVGLPTIVTQAMTSFMVTTFNTILLPLSSTAVAFFGVYYKLQNFLFMPLNGLGQAAIPIVGYNYGSKNKERICQAARVTYTATLVLALAGTLIFQLFGRQLLGLFSASEDMLALGIPALKTISVFFVAASVTMLTGYFASGLGDGVTNMVSAFLRQFFPLIPCAWLLARAGGLDLVWYAFWVSELAALLFALLRLRVLFKTKVAAIGREG